VTFNTFNVEIPDTLKSVNIFGAFAIADSIVAVVTESKEEIFFNCLELLIISALSIYSEFVVDIPEIGTIY
jgi:hypothetical protein